MKKMFVVALAAGAMFVASEVMAQDSGGVTIGGDAKINANASNVTADASGSESVAQNKLFSVGGGTVDVKGDIKVSGSAENITAKASGSKSRACNEVGSIGSSACRR